MKKNKRKNAGIKPAFLNWLMQMPDKHREEITVPVQLTLELHQWLDVAAGCKSSGITIDQAVSRLLCDSDQFCGWFNHNFHVTKDGWPITEVGKEGGAK